MLTLRQAIKRARRSGIEFARPGNTRPVDHTINFRAQERNFISQAAAGQSVFGVIYDGMDCDCTKYRRERVKQVPVSIVAWCKDLEEHYRWLDGPETMYYVGADSVTHGKHESRDLAMEAFEDGHPHVVYA